MHTHTHRYTRTHFVYDMETNIICSCLCAWTRNFHTLRTSDSQSRVTNRRAGAYSSGEKHHDSAQNTSEGVIIFQDEISFWDIQQTFYIRYLLLLVSRLQRGQRQHVPTGCLPGSCSHPLLRARMEIHVQQTSLLSSAMKPVSISPSRRLLPLSTHPGAPRGEPGTHLLFELSKRLPNPISAEDQGVTVGKLLDGLIQALAHGFGEKGNV